MAPESVRQVDAEEHVADALRDKPKWRRDDAPEAEFRPHLQERQREARVARDDRYGNKGRRHRRGDEGLVAPEAAHAREIAARDAVAELTQIGLNFGRFSAYGFLTCFGISITLSSSCGKLILDLIS